MNEKSIMDLLPGDICVFPVGIRQWRRRVIGGMRLEELAGVELVVVWFSDAFGGERVMFPKTAALPVLERV